MSSRKTSQEVFTSSVLESFQVVPDPRVTGRCDHELIDIIAISLCSVLCGCENWIEIEEFAEQRKSWFKQWLELPNGIPSHDTLARVFSLLEPKLFEAVFFDWARAIRGQTKIKMISMDGKAVSGTHRAFNDGTKRLHLLNVLCTESGLSLGQLKARSSGSGEVNAAIECLEILKLKGTLVTVDAGLSVKRLTDKILEKGGDYLIPIKKNQRFYRKELEEVFLKTGKRLSEAKTEDRKHGRTEIRSAEVIKTNNLSDKFRAQWGNVSTAIRLVRFREEKDPRYSVHETCAKGVQIRRNTGKIRNKETTVYYISSRNVKASDALGLIRKHWRIENNLHWQLDVTFKEDAWRVRNQVAAENLSLIRKTAFNLLKKAPGKGSMRIKMKRAGWNNQYLEQVLTCAA